MDSGSGPNILKKQFLKPNIPVDRNEILQLTGITAHHVTTLGLAQIDILGRPVAFHLVEDKFPIPQDGIIGSDFFNQFKANVNYKLNQLEWDDIKIPFEPKEILTIPARANSQIYIQIANPELKEGYVPKLSLAKGVYLGNSLVSVQNGKAHLRVINTNEEDYDVFVPTIQIFEFDELANSNPNSNLNQDSNSKSEASSKSNSKSNFSKVYTISNSSSKESSTTYDVEENKNSRYNKIIEFLKLDHLNDEERMAVEKSIKRNVDCFHLPEEPLEFTNVLQHRIPTSDNIPIHTRQYRFPPVHKEEINRQVKELLDQNIIKPSESPYNTPVWIVPKKADPKGNKRWRMVLDFRALNEKTIGDAYPLPNITDILDQLGGAKYFSVFDLASGFHQIKMHPDDSHKTAFSTPHGHYEFDRMPFGLKNAPATFQRIMDKVLTGMQGTEMFVYLDDIVLYASSLREHEIKFEKLANKLREANLKLQPEKCEFLRKEVTYLGHIISENGVQPDPKKLEAVKNFPVPKNQKNIKQFLGLAGYYRRFIEGFSNIAKPLTNLLKGGIEFKWNQKEQDSFNTLKNTLCQEPVLQYPDFSKPFIITTDASGTAIGAILSQGPIGKDRPISYASRVLNDAEKNYSTIEKELLAIVYAVKHFRPYLYGKKFVLVTDHKPLTWLHKAKDPTSRLARWKIKLAEYDYEIVYKAGKTNVNADALSRNPVQICMIQPALDEIKECPEDEEARIRNANPQPLKLSPQKGSMIEESEPECNIGMQTRGATSTEGESIPFSRKELQESSFTQHIIEAEIHQEPKSKIQPMENLNPKPQKNTDSISLPSLPEENLSSEEEEENIDSIFSFSPSEENTNPIPEAIPPNLLQIIDNLTRDLDDKYNETNNNNDNDSDNDDDDKNNHDTTNYNHRKDKNDKNYDYNNDNRDINKDNNDTNNNDNDNDDDEIDIDKNFNEFDPDTINDFDDLQIITRSQTHSIINSRDQIFMHKENYLYFMSADGKPCDNGSKILQERRLIPQMTNAETGKVTLIKKGNKVHFIFICKNKINDTVTKEILHQLSISFHKILTNTPIKILSVAKTPEIDGFKWNSILNYIRKSLIGFPIKLIICHGLVKIPDIERRKFIIEESHSSVVGGHKGVTKTYNRIRQNFYWDNLKQDIQNYINHCLQCQIKKLVRVKTKQPMLITDTPYSAFEKVSMDIVGPLPTTSQNNSYILTVQDHLTKFSLAIPLKSSTAISVADAFLEFFICTFGTPKTILTDQGSNFMSNLMKRFAKKFRIKQFKTTAFYPQANGALERSHLVLIEFLKQFVNRFTEWDKLVRYAAFSYNTSTHEATGYTPYELVFGKLARLPSSEIIDDIEKPQTSDAYLTQLMTDIHNLQKLARENIITSKIKSKKYYDRKINPQHFQVDDEVFLICEPKKGKLGNQYSGPYTVSDILPNGNIKLLIKGKPKIVHPNKLKKSHIDHPT